MVREHGIWSKWPFRVHMSRLKTLDNHAILFAICILKQFVTEPVVDQEQPVVQFLTINDGMATCSKECGQDMTD